MSETMAPRPLSIPSPHSAPFWEGLKRGEFLVQHCDDCGKPRAYARPMCAQCHSVESSWRPASGSAAVHSWTVVYHAYHPAFAPDLPYTLVTVDLPEGIRALAPLIDAASVALKIGLPLRIDFHRIDETTTLPVLRAVTSIAVPARAG